ncbi:MAG: hypothetical protein ACTSX9_00810 [Candidatus Njordarchaeales archaeon]
MKTKANIIAEIIVSVHATLGTGSVLTRRALAAMLIILKYCLGESNLGKKLEVLEIYNDGVEAASVNNAVNALLSLGELSEKSNGELVLTERGRLLISHMLSSEKRIKLWKLAKILSQYNTRTLAALAYYAILLDEVKKNNEPLDSNMLVRECGKELLKKGLVKNFKDIEMLHELLNGLQQLIREDNLRKTRMVRKQRIKQ